MSDLRPQDDVVLAMLQNAARRGDECPSNSLLATAAGRSIGWAVESVKRLEAAGHIKVKRTRRSRVVALPTGEITAPPRTQSHMASMIQRRAEEAAERRAKLAELVAEHGNVSRAGREMGVSQQVANRMWQRVLEDMGE